MAVSGNRIVSVSVEDGGQGRVVVARYANGEVVRAPVTKKKPTRKPRMKRQKLMDRTRRKQF